MHKRVQMCWYLKQNRKNTQGRERCQALSWLPESWVLPLRVVLAPWDRGHCSHRSCCPAGEELPAAGAWARGLATADPRQHWFRLFGLGLEMKPG